MRKETEHLLTAVAVCLLVLLIMWARVRVLQKEVERLRNAPADTVLVTHTDTIFSERPVPVYKYISRTEFVEVPSDSVRVDTVKELVFLPREYMVYKDSTYRAVVSGVDPRLDSIEIYRPTITNTITKYVEKKKKPVFSLSVGPGVSWDGKKVRPALQATAGFVIKSW